MFRVFRNIAVLITVLMLFSCDGNKVIPKNDEESVVDEDSFVDETQDIDVVEETDETLFWLDILEETGILPNFDLTALKDEITELLKVFAKTRKTAKQH